MESIETPQPYQDNSPFGNGERLKEYVNTERECVDYSRMIAPTTRVLAIGETHTSGPMKYEVINHFKTIQDAWLHAPRRGVFGNRCAIDSR